MTRDEFFEQVNPIIDSTDDPKIIGFFSREEDAYRFKTVGMDVGEVLLLIDGLIKEFGLDAEVIAAMHAKG